MDVIGVGTPESLAGSSPGSWDFAPFLIAALTLYLFRRVLAIQIRWYHAVGTLLLAPLFVAFAARMGTWLAVGLAAAALVAVRHIQARRRRPTV
jgi:hypothetical protein